MKKIRLTQHAIEQCQERGATHEEVFEAVRKGIKKPAKKDREILVYNFTYNNTWQNNYYSIKQVSPVIKEDDDEIVVITVYVFYF